MVRYTVHGGSMPESRDEVWGLGLLMVLVGIVYIAWMVQ